MTCESCHGRHRSPDVLPLPVCDLYHFVICWPFCSDSSSSSLSHSLRCTQPFPPLHSTPDAANAFCTRKADSHGVNRCGMCASRSRTRIVPTAAPAHAHSRSGGRGAETRALMAVCSSRRGGLHNIMNRSPGRDRGVSSLQTNCLCRTDRILLSVNANPVCSRNLACPCFRVQRT